MINLRELLIDWGDFFYYRKLSQELKGINSVLDLGCGSWSPLQKIKKTFYALGVDIHRDCLKKSKLNQTHDKYLLLDVKKINHYFNPKRFDAVMALDLIEHLKKKEGQVLLRKMEQIACKKVIILTPNGFTKQDPVQGNPYQAHQSGWSVGEFKRTGYLVYGLRGLKWLRGDWATIKYRPWFFWAVVSVLSQPFVYFLPQLAYQLFAVKNLK